MLSQITAHYYGCSTIVATILSSRSSYKELLQKDRSAFIHSKNIQELAVEMFKVKKVKPQR